MLKAELLRKIETAVDDAINQSLYGNIEIEFRAGEPVILRYEKTEKLDNRENTRHGFAKR
jgi:sulfatase maturation enzyme AslB (radical SAM superfamily)